MRNRYDRGTTANALSDSSDTAAQIRNLDSDHMRYEAAKASWRREHPNAMSSEYEQAIAAIARACGV